MDEQILRNLLDRNNGYLRIADAMNAGVSRTLTMQFAKNEKLKKAAHGIYVAEDAWPDPLYLLQARNTKIIFSHETALFLHGLSDREALHPVLTVKRGYNAMHLTSQGVTVHTVRAEWFEIGLTVTLTTVGNEVRVYDKERCICDIILKRKKMDIQTFQIAIKSYFVDEDKDIHRLMKYAQQMNLEEKVRQYTEVML